MIEVAAPRVFISAVWMFLGDTTFLLSSLSSNRGDCNQTFQRREQLEFNAID